MFVNCWTESQRFLTGGSPVLLSSVKNLGNEVAEEKIVTVLNFRNLKCFSSYFFADLIVQRYSNDGETQCKVVSSNSF